MKLTKIALVVFILILVSAFRPFDTCQAIESKPQDPPSTTSTLPPGPQKKFERGFMNMLSGWMETPRHLHENSKRKDWLEYGPQSLARGVGWAIARTGAGVYELATAAHPTPHNYESMIQPETIVARRTSALEKTS